MVDRDTERANRVLHDPTQHGQIRISVGTGRLVAGMLEMLAELPSTTDFVAEAAREQSAMLVENLPRHPRRTERDHDMRSPGSVSLDVDTATGVVELLELFAQMPSTPPAVAADARLQAETIERQLPRP